MNSVSMCCYECGTTIGEDDSYLVESAYYCGDCATCCVNCGRNEITRLTSANVDGDDVCGLCEEGAFFICYLCGNLHYNYNVRGGGDEEVCIDCFGARQIKDEA